LYVVLCFVPAGLGADGEIIDHAHPGMRQTFVVRRWRCAGTARLGHIDYQLPAYRERGNGRLADLEQCVYRHAAPAHRLPSLA